MATTDARPGFKLPWSADRNDSDGSASDDPQPHADTDVVDPWGFGRASGVDPSTVAGEASAGGDTSGEVAGDAGSAEPPARRKPNKLMADLTRAMQTAAQTARDETLARLQADAKAFVEEIHSGSGNEANELRRRADEDVAGIREWSKAELARIRDDTEHRIAERKAELEREIEAHAARIERRIERVQAHVGRFEAEMEAFFEKLLAEDDPTHLAAMAENLPEPPSFVDDNDHDDNLVPFAVPTPEPVAEAAPEAATETADASSDDVPAGSVEPGAAGHESVDPELAFAAIQAAAEAAEADEPVEVDAAEPEAVVDGGQPEPAADHAEAVEHGPIGDDSRFAVLGLSPEAAAEAEAEAEVNLTEDREEIATFSDDALAARLAGLVPPDDQDESRAESRTTRVVVTGLISVASIAGFKRQLGRLEGVASVGVSSGPEGEFIFAVTHAPDLSLVEAVTTLTEFGAQVTDATDDVVSVAASDPETTA